MTKIIEVLREKNKMLKQHVALDMRNKSKAKKKGRNYIFKDLSPITSKFNDQQCIKLAKILSMSEADLIELIIRQIDKVEL